MSEKPKDDSRLHPSSLMTAACDRKQPFGDGRYRPSAVRHVAQIDARNLPFSGENALQSSGQLISTLRLPRVEERRANGPPDTR
jgi:hypothetical protein